MSLKKNGFTLIEILAVVVILAILALITIPQITKQIQQSKENLYKEQVTRILEASEKYMQDNDQKLPKKMLDNFDITSTPVTLITLDDLYDGNYIKDSSPKNPIKSSINMDDTIAIYYNAPKNQYDLVYCVSEEYYKYYYNDDEYNNIVLKVCR